LASLPNRNRIPHGRLVLIGSVVAASLSILFSLLSALTVTQIPAWGGGSGATVERLRNVFGLVVPGAGVVLTIQLILGFRTTWIRVGVASLILAVLASLTVRTAVREFAARPYTGEAYSLFADWRTQIPAGTNVLWPVSPVYAWFLLERPSYISVSQLAGIIFSRDLALEGLDRIRSVSGFADEGHLLGQPETIKKSIARLTTDLLAQVCQDERIGFVVASDRVTIDAPSKPWPDSTRTIYLYDCRSYRATNKPG